MLRVVFAFVLASAFGCSGELSDPCDTSIENNVPATPSVTVPDPGRIDIISAEMVIRSTLFSDPDGDAQLTSEWEVWQYAGGEPVLRVWSGTTGPNITTVTLADGTFDVGGSMAMLAEWTDFGARVRHKDASGACGDTSEWSEWRTFRTDDGSSYVFDENQVLSYSIEIPPESWSLIDAEARPPGCVPYQRNYYTGSFEFEGQRFDGVGVRSKGGCGSARHLNGKTAFKVHLSWDDPNVAGCPEARRLHGRKRFTFNNQVQDSSFTHERLGYALYKRMGVPTPRVAHARLHVNGELWGLYLHQEAIDRRMLARWFSSNRGMLYEGTYWCDLLPANVPPDLDDSGCFSRKFKADACSTPEAGDDPTDYSLLRDLVARIEALPDGGFYPEVEAFFDFDTFLSSWSVDSVMAHWDGYQFRIINNYRVYHNPDTDKWTIIPTGIDQTFRGDQDPWDVDGILAQRCLAEPDCEAAFAARLSETIAAFESMGLDQRAMAVYTQIRPHVEADPRKESSLGEFDNQATALRDWIRDRGDRIRQFLANRGF